MAWERNKARALRRKADAMERRLAARPPDVWAASVIQTLVQRAPWMGHEDFHAMAAVSSDN